MSYQADKLDFDGLRYVNIKRCEELYFPLNDWSPTDWACALSGETGEACNKIKKLRRGDNIPLKDVADELADIIIYVDLLAARLKIDLEEAIISKFNEDTDKIAKKLNKTFLGNLHKLPY
jgi:NTP pyrophosphatase (non-canonical NTP hydrolase)